MEGHDWEITLSDMLTLLLTFFVFIISISSFKAVEYKKLWTAGEERAPEKTDAATTSFQFELIKGLKGPRLNAQAEEILDQMEEIFKNSDFQGVDVYYDENKISLMVSEQLSFEGGEFELRKEAKPILTQLIEPINRSPFDVSIEGHTDSLTNPKIDNMELSLQRALVVARFLIANGVKKEKLSVSGYGPQRPIASNTNQEGRMLNRRVEVNIMVNND